MFNATFRVSLLGKLLLLGSLFACLPTLAQTPADNDKKANNKEQEKKEEKKKGNGPLGLGKIIPGNKDRNLTEEQRQEKADRNYEKWLTQARKKYDDPTQFDYKFRVDQDYRDKRREHSNYAFSKNTYRQLDERTTFLGDKLRGEDTLYDNALVENYVNQVGQSLVPANSPFRYSFRVILDPTPDARALSTGTIYVTTGYLSLVDNEAQLAYLLGHEIAHVEKRHWFQDALVANELEDVNRAQEERREKIGFLGGLASMGIGGLAGGWRGVAMGAYIGSMLPTVLKFVVPNQGFSWERVQENEADDYGMKLMFERNYDPKEVPRFYARLQNMNSREPRVSEGFVARTEQVAERVKHVGGLAAAFTVNPALALGAVNLRDLRPADSADGVKKFPGRQQAAQGARASLKRLESLDARLKEKLEKGEIQGTSEEFGSVMADLKRDNGVRAFYYDMFQLAIDNLGESLQIRSNDPYTHFYYGKVLQQTARTPADKANAMLAFQEAIKVDERGTLPGPWLHRALMLIAERNVNQNAEAVHCLQRYVEVYQQISGGALPPNITTVYAYMKDLGNNNWVARPAMNVSTKNIDPLEIIGDAARQPAPVPVPPVAQPKTEVPVKKRN